MCLYFCLDILNQMRPKQKAFAFLTNELTAGTASAIIFPDESGKWGLVLWQPQYDLEQSGQKTLRDSSPDMTESLNQHHNFCVVKRQTLMCLTTVIVLVTNSSKGNPNSLSQVNHRQAFIQRQECQTKAQVTGICGLESEYQAGSAI